jgi:multiple sugar transport system substrate-binding protein
VARLNGAARLALALAGVGACTTDDGKADPIEIAYLRPDNPPSTKADHDAFGDYMAANPHVHIQATILRYEPLGPRLLSDLKNDRLTADLVAVTPSWVCTFADNLADVPEDIVTLAEAQNAFFAAPLAGSTCDGRLKGLPIEYNLEYGGVVVNLDMYQARFPGRTPNWSSWSAFVAEAAALSQFDDTGAARANGLDIDPVWPQPAKHILLSQILQRGGSYWSADGTRFDFGTHAARAALTEMVDWIVGRRVMSRDLVPERNTFVTTRLAMGATTTGWNNLDRPLSAMGYAGTWALPNTVAQVPAGTNRRFEFHSLPPMVGQQHRFVQNSGWALVVPRTSKNPKLAWDIARSIVLDPAAARRWSATAGTLPALRANGTREAAAGDPLLAKVQPLLEQGQWVGYIPAAAIETVEGAIVSNFFDAATGKKTIEKALDDMQTTANAALAQHR